MGRQFKYIVVFFVYTYVQALSIRPLPPRLPPSASNTTSALPNIPSDAQISDPGQPLPQQISGQAPPSIASAGRPPAPHHHPPPQAATDNAGNINTVQNSCLLATFLNKTCSP